MKPRTAPQTLALSLLASTSLWASPTIAVYDLNTPISESGMQSSNPFQLGSPERPLTHFDITSSLKSAIADPEVPAVVLDLDGAALSLAQAQEICSLVKQLRAQKKDVWLYTESLTPSTMLIGSAANHLTLMPTGDIYLQGLYAENMYFKGLLDKVGVKVEVIHIGDFKSAGETFYRDSPSEYAQQQQDILLDSLFQQIVTDIAQNRGIAPDKMRAIIDQGVITPQQALDFKLVDHLKYRTDFVNDLHELYQEDGTEFINDYALPDVNGPKIEGFFDLVKVLMDSGKNADEKSPYIAVVPLEGEITDESIIDARLAILKAARNENCKALVLRVDSPGGSALSSDVLWEATTEFKNSKRPFIVSMGSVAASGGYYISAAADRIFAEPGTITGSIGVVGMKINFAGALEKLGVSVHSSKRGKHADLITNTRSYTEQEEKIIRDSMLHVYGEFKQRILDGRGDRIKGDLEKLAGGRVYSGKDALTIGLVDELGGLQLAIDHAKSLVKNDQINVKLTPEPKSAFDGLFAQPEPDEHEFIQATAARPTLNLQASLINSEILSTLSPSMQQQLNRFVSQLKSIQKHEIQLIAPTFEIK